LLGLSVLFGSLLAGFTGSLLIGSAHLRFRSDRPTTGGDGESNTFSADGKGTAESDEAIEVRGGMAGVTRDDDFATLFEGRFWSSVNKESGTRCDDDGRAGGRDEVFVPLTSDEDDGSAAGFVSDVRDGDASNGSDGECCVVLMGGAHTVKSGTSRGDAPWVVARWSDGECCLLLMGGTDTVKSERSSGDVAW